MKLLAVLREPAIVTVGLPVASIPTQDEEDGDDERKLWWARHVRACANDSRHQLQWTARCVGVCLSAACPDGKARCSKENLLALLAAAPLLLRTRARERKSGVESERNICCDV